MAAAVPAAAKYQCHSPLPAHDNGVAVPENNEPNGTDTAAPKRPVDDQLHPNHRDEPAAKRPRPVAASVAPETEAIFRLVVNVSDTALLIGRGGATVRQIEQDFGARVKRLQEPPGEREQVVIVWSKPAGLPPGESRPAQKALADCVRRIVTQEHPREVLHATPVVKLLINSSQEHAISAGAGSLDSLRSQLGLTACVLRGDDLPACALDNDIMLELSGNSHQLMQAVELVSSALLTCPPTERPGGPCAALKETARHANGYTRY